MPYIVITGQLSGPQLGMGSECTLIAGLPAHERDGLVAELEGCTPGCSKVSGSGSVRVDGRGRVLHLLNRLHDKFGYEVISHSMAITSSNHERMSWTLYRKHSSHGRSAKDEHKERRFRTAPISTKNVSMHLTGHPHSKSRNTLS